MIQGRNKMQTVTYEDMNIQLWDSQLPDNFYLHNNIIVGCTTTGVGWWWKQV